MNAPLTIGSLFSGIGGFDLGLERTGHMRTVWFCEQDPFCQRVLAKHWPGVPVHPDVRALVADTNSGGLGQPRVRAEQPQRAQAVGTGEGDRPMRVPVPHVDILCGGFPCQDISVAGRGAGIDGQRSGLWSQYARLIRDLRPRYVIVENVAALLARGMERVLGDLAALGFDAEWDCIPASAVGAPHRRDRVWLVAYPNTNDPRRRILAQYDGGSEGLGRRSPGRHADRLRDEVADAYRSGWDGRTRKFRPGGRGESSHGGSEPAGSGLASWWSVEPDVGRVAHGVPNRVDRLRALGNALVPQIAEWIGWRIIEWESR